MTAAFGLHDRVTVAWSPPGTTERVETTGIMIARAARGAPHDLSQL